MSKLFKIVYKLKGESITKTLLVSNRLGETPHRKWIETAILRVSSGTPYDYIRAPKEISIKECNDLQIRSYSVNSFN